VLGAWRLRAADPSPIAAEPLRRRCAGDGQADRGCHSGGVSKVFRAYEPRQSYLLPPSPLDWLPEGHLAYFILDVVDELDLSPIFAHHERELRGKPPHHPRVMVALLLYGYCTGVTSSRQIERRTHEDVAFRVLSGGTHPDHVRISEFRRIHLAVLSALFLQVLRLCQKAGMVKLGHVSLDGTKMKASASKHKAMSYARMQQQEAALAAKVKDLLAVAERIDAGEDAQYGAGVRGDELPAELQRAETRLARIREAKAALEADAKAAREADKKKEDDDGSGGSDAGGGASGGGSALPSHRVPSRADGMPTDKAQRNFVDPESRIMKTGDGFVQGYNAQIVVDEAHQIIVAQALSNQSPDAEYLLPLMEQASANCGAVPTKMSADAGYFSEANVEGASDLGVDVYIATGRLKHGQSPPSVRGRPRGDLTPKQRMARKLATQRGAKVYRRRKVIVEPVFGQIKHARGFRQLQLRGRTKARGEWSLICLGHNLCKLHRFRTAVRVPS
jgi:transposase